VCETNLFPGTLAEESRLVARFSEDPAQKKATMAHRVLMGPGHFFGGAAAAIARMSLISRYSVRGKSVKDSKPRWA